MTNVKQIHRQSDLTIDVEFCWPILPHSHILSVHHFKLRSLHFQSLQSLPNWIKLPTSKISPMCTPNNKNTLPSFTAFYEASFGSSYFTLKRAAKTLHLMSPCTPVSVPAKITWYPSAFCRFLINLLKSFNVTFDKFKFCWIVSSLYFKLFNTLSIEITDVQLREMWTLSETIQAKC